MGFFARKEDVVEHLDAPESPRVPVPKSEVYESEEWKKMKESYNKVKELPEFKEEDSLPDAPLSSPIKINLTVNAKTKDLLVRMLDGVSEIAQDFGSDAIELFFIEKKKE